jgi:hypothetical protein
VTVKHMPGAIFKKEVKKAAPKLFNAAQEIRHDPGYRHLSSVLRERLDELIEQLDQLEKNGEV